MQGTFSCALSSKILPISRQFQEGRPRAQGLHEENSYLGSLDHFRQQSTAFAPRAFSMYKPPHSISFKLCNCSGSASSCLLQGQA